MRVSNLMTRSVHACTSVDTLNRAAQLLWEHDIGCVPVVDGERRVIGIVTDRDIAMAAYTQGRGLAELTVAACMSRQVQSVRADDAIQVAAGKMREHRVRRLAVVDERGRLVGMLSISDLSQRLWPRGTASGFDDDELLSVIAAVSQPRRARDVDAVAPALAKPKPGDVSVSVRPMKKPGAPKTSK
ncbi:MAG: CBS domain-containing protein [Planctomycetota bacterium]|nr:MAG: CBS domain-containing protein [Planctomycetota bacterium]